MNNNGHDKQRILLVDDHKHLLTTLGDFLAFEGFEVVPASSGEEAMLALDEGRPDLIVLDIGMPGMGGLGLLKRISEGGTPKFPVLVLTARATMEEFFGTIPVDGFLAKPCSEEKLLGKIREILGRRGITDDLAFGQGRRLLLGEDDPLMVSKIKKGFDESHTGFVFDIAANGPEVLEKASSFHPDVIVMNEILHGMNGSEVAYILGSMVKTRAIPVVLYDETHSLDSDRIYRCRVSGRREEFVQSADADVLLRAVEEVLVP
jgi:DNA-binding response OmpR family regulator